MFNIGMKGFVATMVEVFAAAVVVAVYSSTTVRRRDGTIPSK